MGSKAKESAARLAKDFALALLAAIVLDVAHHLLK